MLLNLKSFNYHILKRKLLIRMRGEGSLSRGHRGTRGGGRYNRRGSSFSSFHYRHRSSSVEQRYRTHQQEHLADQGHEEDSAQADGTDKPDSSKSRTHAKGKFFEKPLSGLCISKIHAFMFINQ